MSELVGDVAATGGELAHKRFGRERLQEKEVDAVVDRPGVEQGEGLSGRRSSHARYTTAQGVNSPESEQFDFLYGRLWRALHRPDDDDLAQHEIQLLHHVPMPGAGSVTLHHLARHLALPKSTASVVVKDL